MRRFGARLSLCVLWLLQLAAATELHAQDHPGAGLDALPGVHEVPFGVHSQPGVQLRTGAAYGWTESVLDMDDSHHRFQLDAAGSVSPAPWFAAALRVLARYDVHTGPSDSDSGIITETHLGARATVPLGADVQAGSQLELWLPGGNNVGDALSAVSGDLQLLVAYAPQASPWTLGLALGLRLDRSSHAGGEPDRYSAADRLALGASEAEWALRQGLALSYRTGSVEWVAEWAFRMYFAQIAESPMWIRAGARYRPANELQLELLLGASPSKRPSLEEGEPLAVVEPRVWAGLAATYAWPTSQPSAAAPARPAPVVTPVAPARDGAISGKVVAAGGAVVPAAAVTLRSGENARESVADANGVFAFSGLTAGEHELSVNAPGFVPAQQSVALSGEPVELTITLERELPSGQIRGTVRRFDGRPIVASVAIPELDISQKTRDDGTFELDVQPGEYSVTVTAPGFRQQTRKARVELRGVAILIIELERAR